MIMSISNTSGRKLLSCREAAQEYGCSMAYIRRLAREKKLEQESIGGTYFVTAVSLRRLAAKAEKGTGRARKRAEGFKAG